MGKVLVVSKGTVVQQLSHLGWSLFLFMISLELRPLCRLMISTLHPLLELYLFSVGNRGVPGCRGYVRTPRLHCYTLSHDVSFNFD